jgi:hypothetical protein
MDRKLSLLKMHPFSEGLTDDELKEIADCTDLVEYAHHANVLITAVSLIV